MLESWAYRNFEFDFVVENVIFSALLKMVFLDFCVRMFGLLIMGVTTLDAQFVFVAVRLYGFCQNIRSSDGGRLTIEICVRIEGHII